MRVLVINPALVRLHSLGACEQDRLRNIDTLRRLGHSVHVLTGWMPYQSIEEVQRFYAERQMDSTLSPIGGGRSPGRWLKLAQWDGMAWEYASPEFLDVVQRTLAAFQPNRVWCHGSYLWAPALAALRSGVPAVVRSVNYEPMQLLHENRRSPRDVIRYLGKAAGERRAASATVLAAITPVEANIYRQIAPKANVALLPLQTLPDVLRPPRAQPARSPLRVFFMGASYNVAHNRQALQFILDDLVPLIRAQAPGEFVFHIFGSKVPADLAERAADDVRFDGYVPDLNASLEAMDIALAPSLAGVGMQQKVFEPICRAFPTVTHARALAGYAFEPGVHVLTAEDAAGYAAHLLSLREPQRRAALSQQAAAQAAQLFSQAALDARVSALMEA